jgi:hypothetical protein
MAEHKMPAGIVRKAKGIYETTTGSHRIVQGDDGWTVEPTVDGSPFKTRGLAVAKLAELGLLPTEAPATQSVPTPKPEAKAEAKPRPIRRQPKAKATATA